MTPEDPKTIHRYEIVSELGRGAMGLVYLAFDPVLDRHVALKFLRPDLKITSEEKRLLVQRIQQEARAMARLSHPGIVALHDLGEEEQLGLYLVFEHASGPTLEAALQRGRLTVEGVARLAQQLGEALSRAHEKGIVHRDIKPANIILTEEGAKIADFGVARLPESTLTRAGAQVGTPAYSAPESLRSAVHSAQSDQFSFAATLYEALSGRRAFPGQDTSTVAQQIAQASPFPIARQLGLRDEVDQILRRGMSIHPEERYPSCQALGEHLCEVLQNKRPLQPTLPDERPLPALSVPPSSSQKWGLIVLCLLLGATLTLLVQKWGAAPSEPLPPAPQPAEPPPAPAYLSPVPGELNTP